jgi:molecular chaperone DnaJ
MSKLDYYEVLGIDRNANKSDIKKAYRKIAKENHPDSGGNEEEFKLIAEAYEVLSDDTKKTNYDRYGHNGPKGGNGFGADFNDFFSQFGFGGGQQRQKQRRGQDLRLNIKLTLEEIHEGSVKKIKYNREEACMSCNSVGGHNQTTCRVCNGRGVIVENIRTPIGVMQNMTTCYACNGHGTTYSTVCSSCSGKGTKTNEQVLDVEIPAGITDGASMKFEGLGQAIKNGTSGSLVIIFNEIPHKKFVRYGNDLKYNLKLPYHTLVLGGKSDIDTIDGNKIKINIPELNKVGDTLRISGKGVNILNRPHRGDLFVTLDIEMPNSINDAEKEILEKLKNLDDSVVETEN